jgi:uncharacterized protein with HEPN domain
MRPENRDLASLADMMRATDKLARYLSGGSAEDLEANEMLQDAVVRQFTVLGEAAARVSPDTRKLDPVIPWSSIVGVRNVITHRYDDVDYGELWRMFAQDVPGLRERVERLLELLQHGPESA